MSGEKMENQSPEQNPGKLKELWAKVRGRMSELFTAPGRGSNDEPDKDRRKFLVGASAATLSPAVAPIIAKATIEVVSGKISLSAMQRVARLMEVNARYGYNILSFVETLASNPRAIQDAKQMLGIISSGKIDKAEDLASFLSKERFFAARELISSSHFLSGLSIDDLKDKGLMEAVRLFNPKLADSLDSDIGKVVTFMEEYGFSSLDDIASSVRVDILNSVDSLFKRASKDPDFARANKELLKEAHALLNQNFGLYFQNTPGGEQKFKQLLHGLGELLDKLYDVVDLSEFEEGKEKSIYNDILNILYSNSYAGVRNFARRNLGKQIILRAEGGSDVYAFESKKGFEFGKVFNELLRKSPHKCVRVELAEKLD